MMEDSACKGGSCGISRSQRAHKKVAQAAKILAGRSTAEGLIIVWLCISQLRRLQLLQSPVQRNSNRAWNSLGTLMASSYSLA